MVDMVNFDFLGKFLGKKDAVSLPQSEAAPRQEDPKILALRERNFQNVLDQYLRRPATDRERSRARAVLIDAETGNLEAIAAEEMLARLAKAELRLQLRPDPEPENMIGGKVFEPRGNRESNFERGLAKALGREVTAEDLAEAQEFIDRDPATRAAFKVMTGEEASHYAEKVARRMLIEQLRNPSASDQQRKRA